MVRKRLASTAKAAALAKRLRQVDEARGLVMDTEGGGHEVCDSEGVPEMPTACKSCSSCNYTFRRDVSLPLPPPVTRDDTTTAETTSPTTSTTVVRRTERTRRERPDYFDAMEYEQYFRRERRKRCFSQSSASDDSCKKRGRPKGSIIKEKLHVKEAIVEANDSRSSGESAVKDEDLFASIPAEKAMQFAIILAEINRKCVGQHFNPS